ncbi:hypothetical protein [Pyruvatibacter mobilis]|uniref:hypothetical protein n=1 Tax=Pyruvatibacter mobilis TaxID=1712261 RepID=UPI003BA85195
MWAPRPISGRTGCSTSETGEAVATAEAVAVTLDLVARKAIPIPDAMRTHLESQLVEGIGA